MTLTRQEPEALTRQLVALGVRSGSVVMVHAGLRKLGPVRGGADGVLDALLAAVGQQGTLMMVLGADPDEPFDALTTEVDVEDMGMLAEIFRQRPGVQVSDHAAARYAACGPAAEALLADVPLHDYHGPNSPLHRLCDAGGDVVRLGADADTLTLTHYAEYLAVLPQKIRVRRRYVRADIGEQFIESLDDDDGIAEWGEGDYFSAVLAAFIQAGHARLGPVGQFHRAECFSAPAFVSFAKAWLERHLGGAREAT